jgi:hypothetical protein
MPSIQEIQIRDPYILRWGGKLYLYGSTDPDIWKKEGIGFDVYSSTGDLTKWEGPFPAFRPGPDFWSKKNFWAPEVYEYQGAFYMFATFAPVKGRRGTAVLRAERPLGPFLPWSAGPVTPPEWESLDGTLWIENSRPYMVFCHEWQQVGNGEICVLALSDDLQHSIGEPTLLFRAHDALWPEPLPNRAPGSYVTDGPNLRMGTDGKLYMLWSSFVSSGYALGVAISDSGKLNGPWKQEDKPLYSSDGGHGMLFVDNASQLRLAVHTPNDSPNERAVFLPITQQDGHLVLLKEGDRSE